MSVKKKVSKLLYGEGPKRSRYIGKGVMQGGAAGAITGAAGGASVLSGALASQGGKKAVMDALKDPQDRNSIARILGITTTGGALGGAIGGAGAGNRAYKAA